MAHMNLVLVNLVANTIGLTLSLLGIITLLMIKIIKGKYFSIMMRIFSGNIILISANLIEMVIYYRNESGFDGLLYASVFLQFIMGFVMEYFFVNYVLYSIEQKGFRLTRIKRGFTAYFGIAIFSVLISMFHHGYFYIDDRQLYQRGEFYWVSQAFALLGLAALAFICLKYIPSFGRYERIILAGYLILPIGAVIIQVFFQGLYFLTILGILIGLLLYIEIIIYQDRLRKQQDVEITQMQVKVMLSQIQPHFLYNSLTTARYLCEDEPQKAALALEHLTQFLRGNIDSLKIQTLVPFEKEKFHVENYLYLETLRFGEKLKIEWDVKCSDFSLPTLTIQPIVENAVKYGVLQKPEGGCVQISTSQDEKNYYIDVVDDGVGFDMMETKYDGRTHIGLSNVKKRLEEQCGGRLDAVSVPGKGTSVRITIPKEAHIE